MAEDNPFGNINDSGMGNTFNELLKANDFITPDLTQLNPATKGSIGNYYAGNLSQAPSSPSPYNLQDHGPLFMESLSQSAYDPTEYASPIKFNATRHGENFNRYYTHPEFKNLGFVPYRDNETLYNQNSTSYQDWQRGNDHFFNLVWSGIKSGFRSWGDLLSFDPMTPDYATAEEQAEAMSVGYSSRGGVGAFANNLVLNSAHTVGILAEMAMEEGVLLGITALSGGSAAPVTIPTMFARGLNALKLISKGLPTVNKFGKATRNINRAMGELNDVNKARQYWKTVGNFLNPLERTTDYIKGAKNAENLLEFTKNHSLFGSFYRDVREINFALAESKLEGGLVANEMSEDLYNKFYMENGRVPTSQEAKEIASTANKAGFSTVGWNLPIIMASNKIVFDNMFKGFRPFTRAGGSKIDDALSGRLIFDRRASKKGLDPFKFEEKNFKNALKGLYKPSSYGRFGLSYLKANFTEGAQEIFQEVVSGTTKDYYTALYDNDIARGGAWYNIGQNLKKQASWGGFEVFMSGFLMGGLIQPIISIPKYGGQAAQYFGDKEGYQAKKTQRKAQRDQVAQRLNDMYKDPLKYFSPEMHNLAVSKKIGEEMDNAQDQGDRKQFQDLKDQGVYEHIITAIQTGKIEFFKNYMSSMKNMSENELKESFGYNVPNAKTKDFHSKIDKVLDRASKIEARYEYLHGRFKNPFSSDKYDFMSDPIKYIEENKKYVAFNNALRHGTFMMHSFDRTLERMNSIYQDLNADAGFFKSGQVGKAFANDINILFGNIQNEGGSAETNIFNELEALKNEIDVLSEGTSEQKKQATKKKKKLKTLTKLSEEMANLRMRLKEGSKVNEKGQLQLDFEGKKIENARERAYKAYKDYLHTIAEINGNFVDTEQIEKSFAQLMDYTELNNEAENLTDSIRILLDPMSFYEMAKRQSEILDVQYENKLRDIKKALDEYELAMDRNKLLSDLFKAGYFFDPQYIDDLIQNNVLPPEFYRVADKQVVSKTSHPEDWAKIMKVFKNWSDMTEKPIPEAEYETDYDTSTRNKYKRDKRTYADYAKQFGFDPNTESTELLQKDVLEAIISDPNRLATPRERKLAEALLRHTKDTDKIFFINFRNSPGEYIRSSNKIEIDARYSSQDYSTGDTPLEHVILHEIIHKLTVKGLNEDENYKLGITKLYQAARDHFKKNKVGRQEEFYGLKNIYEFVAEAMTNDTFQKYLKGIKYEGTEKSAWEEFLDVVSRFLAKVLNLTGTNNILDQTIALTTKKIDLKTDDVVDKGPSIGFSNLDEFNKLPAELQKQLKLEYKKYKKKIEENTDETPNELGQWFKDSDSARQIINKFNKDLKDKRVDDSEDFVPPEFLPKDDAIEVSYDDFSEEEINRINSRSLSFIVLNSVQNSKLNHKTRDALISIGDKTYKIINLERLSSTYKINNESIQKFLASDINNDIQSWLKDPKSTMHVYQLVEIGQEGPTESDDAFVNLKENYTKIKTIEQLEEWQKEAEELLSSTTLAERNTFFWRSGNRDQLNSTFVDKLIAAKAKSLPKLKLKLLFENVKIGDQLILKDKTKVRTKPVTVIKKTSKQIIVEDENGERFKINKSNFAEKVKSKKQPIKSKSMDKDNKTFSKETLENLEDANEDNISSIDEADKKSKEEIDAQVGEMFKKDCEG